MFYVTPDSATFEMKKIDFLFSIQNLVDFNTNITKFHLEYQFVTAYKLRTISPQYLYV